MTAPIFNAFPKHIQHPAIFNLSAYTIEEFIWCIRLILTFQFLIRCQLRQLNKPQCLTMYQAEGFIVMGRFNDR